MVSHQSRVPMILDSHPDTKHGALIQVLRTFGFVGEISTYQQIMGSLHLRFNCGAIFFDQCFSRVFVGGIPLGEPTLALRAWSGERFCTSS